MALINLLSPKGGVGCTTLCANLGMALEHLGYQVVLVDLDPQNALRLHFQLPLNDPQGLIDRFDADVEWRQLVTRLSDGVDILPFGNASDARLSGFADMQRRPGELSHRLRTLSQTPNTLVVVDANVFPLCEVSPLIDDADLNLLVLMADAGSVALMPRLESQPGSLRQASEQGRLGYLINQIDTRSRLKREIVELMLKRLAPLVVGAVHRDESLAEALAEQRSLFEQAPFSAAARDIEKAARTLAQQFPLRFAGIDTTARPAAGLTPGGVASTHAKWP
ncbi:cellulose biosynthesis protein BcsQ [Salinicola aestuarinus]|uniref:cellulose biosynthesis protein BcsQ n=1 Tax=Salinicola aestuarinus TaxID=1949082 RepID=UPI000DA219D3|nr:cellulose biosynthesis protein BcsQ [Salinicola aestuarinus]